MKHKLLFLLTFILFLLYTAPITAIASESISGQLPSPPDITTQLPVITEISDPNSKYDLSALPPFRIMQNTTGADDSIFYYISELFRISAIAIYPDGTIESLLLNVDWDVVYYDQNPIDQTVPGIYPVTGTICFPAGYEVADSVLKQLTFNAEVYIPEEKIKIVRMDSSYQFNTCYALQPGETPDLESIEHTWLCYDSEENSYLSDLIWNIESLDLSSSGLYTLTPDFAAPLHCIFDESAETFSYPELSVTFSVQKPGQPDINCFNKTRSVFSFPWVTPPGSLENVKAFLSTDMVNWTQLDPYSAFSCSENNFMLMRRALIPGNIYYLQVDYDGGQTGIATLDYTNELTLTGYNYGDRDGGDTNGNNPGNDNPESGDNPGNDDGTEEDNEPESDNDTGNGDNASDSDDTGSNDDSESEDSSPENSTENTVPSPEPLPTPEQTPAADISPVPQPETVVSVPDTPASEVVVPETVPAKDNLLPEDAISGKTFLQMLASSQKAYFSNSGCTVIFTEDTFSDFEIKETDSLQVVIEQPSSNEILLRVLYNNTEPELSGTYKLQIPYKQTSEACNVCLFDANGSLISEGTYEPAQHILTFSLSQTGLFYIEEQTAPKDTAAEENTAENTVTEESIAETEIVISKETTPDDAVSSADPVFSLKTLFLLLPLIAVILTAAFLSLYFRKRK